MASESPVAVRDVRERTIAVLSDLFANDGLDVDDFERRVTLLHRAATVAEIEQVVADLPQARAQAQSSSKALAVVKPAPAAPLVPTSQVRPKQTLVNIMSGTQRRGAWNCPQHLRVVAVMGGAELDFREARLPGGLTTLSVWTLMGGVHVIVPPSLAVEVSGSAFMGGFDEMERASVEPDPDRATLVVRGFAMMGGVHIETRLVGESAGDAGRRRRRERKERKLLTGK